MPYLFIFLATLASLISGFLLNNAATTPATDGQAKSIRLVLFILSGFLFITAGALLTAALLLHHP